MHTKKGNKLENSGKSDYDKVGFRGRPSETMAAISSS
jgi:hypothetical protein